MAGRQKPNTPEASAAAPSLMTLPAILGPFAPRPRLAASVAAGVVVGIACAVLFPQLKPPTLLIIAWDTLSTIFIVSMLISMASRGPELIRARAAHDDEGRHTILVLVLVAVAASLGAIVAELSLAKSAHGLMKWAHILPAFGTVTLSWFIVQLIFAIHYAHEYYGLDPCDGEGDSGGLQFPGGEPPDYWDFLHFSIVIGVASQTADIAFTSKPLRRLGTLHSLVAFAFNTAIVALTINLLAGLF